jgi:ferredoxin/flavodoxin---NADP+ reductase
MKDLTIIGAGPVGLYASHYATLRGVSVDIIDSNSQVGGQLSMVYPDKLVHDLPGYKEIKAKDFIQALVDQVDFEHNKNVTLHLNEEIEKIDKAKDHFVIKGTKNTYESKAVLITVGNGMFAPRLIGLPNEKDFKNIYYSVQDIDQFKNKTITVLGGGDSALDWALMFEPIAKAVNIVHRRDAYRAKEDSVAKLDKSKVKQYMNYSVEALKGTKDQAKELVIKNNETKKEETLKQDCILVNYGNITKLDKGPQGINADRVGATNVEGVFACGNATNYEGKQKLVTTGLGEVPTVMAAIKGFIDPSSKGKIFLSSMSK